MLGFISKEFREFRQCSARGNAKNSQNSSGWWLGLGLGVDCWLRARVRGLGLGVESGLGWWIELGADAQAKHAPRPYHRLSAPPLRAASALIVSYIRGESGHDLKGLELLILHICEQLGEHCAVSYAVYCAGYQIYNQVYTMLCILLILCRVYWAGCLYTRLHRLRVRIMVRGPDRHTG